MAEEQQESLVKRRERAWYLRREVGVTARQDVYAAYFDLRDAFSRVSSALLEAEQSEYDDPLVAQLKRQMMTAKTSCAVAQEQVKEAQNTVNALVHYPLPTE